jgi:hypothetical protein
MEALLEAPEAPMPAEAPAFFSKIFQNFKLSSAASDMLAKTLLDRFAGVLTSSSQHLAVGAQAAVEDSALVGRDLDSSDESRVAPDAEGVVGETARADNLAVVGAPAERGDLRAGVDAVDASARGRVPEVDVTVIRTTASGEEVHVPGAPGESLDGSLVVGLGELGNRQRSSVPDGDEVVVAASSELGTIGAPLKTADLRSVRDKLSDLVLGDADIVVEDEAAAGTSGEEVLVPAHDTNTGLMAEHAADLLALGDIPDLDLTGSETNTDVGAIARPLDTADVGVGSGLKKAADTALIGRPDVDVALKTNGNLVAGAPVKKVEVVVVDQAGGIENTLRSGSDAASQLGRAGGGRPERPVVLLSQIDGLGRLRGGGLELQDTGVEAHAASVGQGVLVGNSVGRGSGVVRLIVIVDVQVLESSHGLVSSSGKNRGAVGAAALRSLPVRQVQLARASVGDGGAGATVGDETVTAVVECGLGGLATDALLGLCAGGGLGVVAGTGESEVRNAQLESLAGSLNATSNVGLGGVPVGSLGGRSGKVRHKVAAIGGAAVDPEVAAGLSLGGEGRRVQVDGDIGS